MSLAAVALLTLVVLPACGLEHKKPDPEDDMGDIAADRLDFSGEDSFFDDLDPAERKAVERSGIGNPRPADEDTDTDPAPEPQKPQSKSETAGKVGLSVLSVAMTIGAAVAPFLLF
jgi:hypothetical protein